MRLVEFTADSLRFVEAPSPTLPEGGFLWISLERDELPAAWPMLQQAAQDIGGSPLLDLHCRDLANPGHASYYDYTSVYDLVMFRRLATQQELTQGLPEGEGVDNGNGNGAAESAALNGAGAAEEANAADAGSAMPAADNHAIDSRSRGQVVRDAFARIHALTVGFAVYDRLLISVHPRGCHSANSIVRRLLEDARQGTELTATRSRLPNSPVDLSLRMINVMVDGYLEIRRALGAQIKHWQTELLNPNGRFTQWNALMDARSQLDWLEDLCDEQRDAIQEWLEALREQPLDAFHPDRTQALMRQDQLGARARDVVEHIDRVLRHVQRMAQTAETAVQIHFSAQGNRTNDIMLVLTAITAIFLPLNLITGIFGMNFNAMPLLQNDAGFWIAMLAMAAIALGLGMWFWRKRYLSALN
ncbi:MAG: magnesium transporter CorA family protein [Brachymonas sp.]|nr:magnesium transporter CorA family protein [Brachymonas sp.]